MTLFDAPLQDFTEGARHVESFSRYSQNVKPFKDYVLLVDLPYVPPANRHIRSGMNLITEVDYVVRTIRHPVVCASI